jgi:ribosomal protein S18 acetylase RimI-like enzyme
MPDGIVDTPWDSKALGIDTYEILDVSESVLKQALKTPGHYTVKVDPLSSKKLLHEHGFYFCDTLIVPYCTPDVFIFIGHEGASVSRNYDIEELAEIVPGTFSHGRYHRDFNIDSKLADKRYENWLRQLHESNALFALMFEDKVAGFLGYMGNNMALHAIGAGFRGKGLAKYLWSVACKEMFEMGHEEITSSVSTSNTAIMNLYSSLGFIFRDPIDIYHILVR